MNVAPPVSPSPRFPKQRLLELVRTLSGVQAVWSTRKRGLEGLRPGTERAWVLVGVQSYVPVGVDELRHEFDPVLNRNAEILIGQRNFTMVLRAQSLTETLEATDLLERVRFRLRTVTARAIMVPLLALRDFGAVISLPDSEYNLGGVIVGQLEATLDVRMACVLAADPMDGGEFIETVGADDVTLEANGTVGSLPSEA